MAATTFCKRFSANQLFKTRVDVTAVKTTSAKIRYLHPLRRECRPRRATSWLTPYTHRIKLQPTAISDSNGKSRMSASNAQTAMTRTNTKPSDRRHPSPVVVQKTSSSAPRKQVLEKKLKLFNLHTDFVEN